MLSWFKNLFNRRSLSDEVKRLNEENERLKKLTNNDKKEFSKIPNSRSVSSSNNSGTRSSSDDSYYNSYLYSSSSYSDPSCGSYDSGSFCDSSSSSCCD